MISYGKLLNIHNMVSDKMLVKIQSQINVLAPTLDLFVEDSIQPSVSDCESLQIQLTKLHEYLAVYKYHKLEKELSPSFKIHAQVSKQNINDIKSEISLSENKEFIPQDDLIENTKVFEPMSIGINDKFRLINELFKQNGGEYNIAIEQLNALNNWNESELYLNSLKTIYNWKDNSEGSILIYTLCKKRFL